MTLLTVQILLAVAAATCTASAIGKAKQIKHVEEESEGLPLETDTIFKQNSAVLARDPADVQYHDEVDMSAPAILKRIIKVQNFGIGSVIKVSFTPTPGGNLHVLNLASASGDILFHFNPRYFSGAPVMVFNSYLNGAWGPEERPAGFPFQASSVQAVVVVEEGGYRITVNGGAFTYLYKHRRSLSLVSSMDTDFDDLQYGFIVSAKDCKDDKIGKVIYINGALPGSNACGAGVCTINLIHAPPSLLATPTKPPSSNIALHFNPRFYLSYVVRNSFIKGGWGAEETSGGMPFSPNSPYKMAITLQQDGYELAVNGDHFVSYKYRLPLDSSMTVLVSSTMVGSSVKVQVL